MYKGIALALSQPTCWLNLPLRSLRLVEAYAPLGRARSKKQRKRASIPIHPTHLCRPRTAAEGEQHQCVPAARIGGEEWPLLHLGHPRGPRPRVQDAPLSGVLGDMQDEAELTAARLSLPGWLRWTKEGTLSPDIPVTAIERHSVGSMMMIETGFQHISL